MSPPTKRTQNLIPLLDHTHRRGHTHCPELIHLLKPLRRLGRVPRAQDIHILLITRTPPWAVRTRLQHHTHLRRPHQSSLPSKNKGVIHMSQRRLERRIMSLPKPLRRQHTSRCQPFPLNLSTTLRRYVRQNMSPLSYVPQRCQQTTQLRRYVLLNTRRNMRRRSFVRPSLRWWNQRK
jgi:hypothetical protein